MFILPVCTHIHHSVYMEVRWRLAGAGSLLLPRGFQGRNSSSQAWGQVSSHFRSLPPENEFLFPIYPRHWHQHVYTPIIISHLRIRKPFPHFLCLIKIYCLSSHSTAVTKHSDLSNLEKAALGAGEMAQRLRALPALPKVLSSIPSNHMVAHNHL